MHITAIQRFEWANDKRSGRVTTIRRIRQVLGPAGAAFLEPENRPDQA